MSAAGNASSIATELQREGFVVDTQRAAIQQDVLGEHLNGTFYKSADGRAALVMHTAAGEVGGEIYDAAGKILRQLSASKAPVRTAAYDCTYSGIYWNSSSIYTVEISTCTDGSGSYCWATCDSTTSTCSNSGSGCITTSCSCSEPPV